MGCGWLGLPLARHLIEQGHVINGSTTSTEKIAKLQSHGITPLIVNIEEPDPNIEKFLNSDILIISITSKNVYDFEQLILRIQESPIRKVLFVSSTSVYPNTNSEVDEDSPTKETALAQIEQLFRKNDHLESTILRFGGLFGYDRKPGNFARPGRKMDNPDGYINLIHQDDCINIIDQIIVQGAWGETFNACADTHPTRRDFYTQQVLKLGRPVPEFDEDSANEYKIVSNTKIKARLGYSLLHADLMAY